MDDNSSKQDGGNAGAHPAQNENGSGPGASLPAKGNKKPKKRAGAVKPNGPNVLEQAQNLKALLDSGKLPSETVASTRVMARGKPLRLIGHSNRGEMFAAFIAAGKPFDAIVVRRVGDGSDKLEVVDGEDRWRGAQIAQQFQIRVVIIDCTADVGFALAGLLNTGNGILLNDDEKLAFAIALLKSDRQLRQMSDRDLERACNDRISDTTFNRARHAIGKRKKKPAKKPHTPAEKPLPAPKAPELDNPTSSSKVIAAKSVNAPGVKVESLDTSQDEVKHLARALYRATAELATRLKMPRKDVYARVCQILDEEI